MSMSVGILRSSLVPAVRRPFVTTRLVSSPFNRYRTMATKEFLCILPDKPDALARRLEVRPTHLENAQGHKSNGKIAVGGAMFEKEHPVEGQTPGFKGSVMIYTVKDAEEAWELIRGDVYAKNDVWDLEKAQVIPFKSAIRESL
ncbi:hypothetical protein CABS03_01643 [Colletotrichum abscissum]|uniref:YCII-related domain-containing protein n=6 Tax=Colletotrichum acutatum species complex TaxID=2707335 RepID=A0A9P9XKN5_9PEZI|nr:hypothetical protein CABS02_04806 [Colletotrichum abscissum]KAK0381709.1 hypothetical protein CLIM01_00950 [Colletotrichum limetticola]